MKKLLITGGTGSFGQAAIRHFINSDFETIIIFSRDEKKQEDVRASFANKKVRFIIGDVRDVKSVDSVIRGVTHIFHAAALKQVPSCEFFPLEAIKTNVIGTSNVLEAAIRHAVERVVVLSTDKAVYPINAMGMSKALSEKIAAAAARSGETNISITRYGNVMSSRNSVIPRFVDQILEDGRVTITDPLMTRYLMSLDQSVDLVSHAMRNGGNGDIYVKKSPSSTIGDLADAIFEILGKPRRVTKIGWRHGEKLHETLVSREEMLRATDYEDYIAIAPDERSLDYSKYETCGNNFSLVREYNSENARRLSMEELIQLVGPEVTKRLSERGARKI